MIIGELERRTLDIFGNNESALVMPFNSHNISHRRVINNIRATKDKNEDAHGLSSKEPLVPGYMIESLIQYLNNKALQKVGRQDAKCEGYEIFITKKSPVNCEYSGEIIIRQPEGENLTIIPQIRISSEPGSICGAHDSKYTSLFSYQENLPIGTNITIDNSENDTEKKTYQISASDLKQFKRSMQLDVSKFHPENHFISALSSYALFQKIYDICVAESRIPIYASRKVRFFDAIEDCMVGDILTLSSDTFKDKKLNGVVRGYNSNGEQLFETVSKIGLIDARRLSSGVNK